MKKLQLLFLSICVYLTDSMGQGLTVNPSDIRFYNGTTNNGVIAQTPSSINFGTLTGFNLNFLTNGQNRLHLGSNGNIGVGAGFITPQSLFHIYHNTGSNDASPQLRLTQNADTHSGRIRMENSNATRYFMNKFFHNPVGNSILNWDYNGTELFRVESNANFSINGFTKLGGSTAPAIKTLKLLGTTASSENADATVPHGLILSKIISVRILVDNGSELIESGYTVGTNSRFNFKVNATDVVVTNVNLSSSSILSKPMRIFITYEE
jgi:hypothetical protein